MRSVWVSPFRGLTQESVIFFFSSVLFQMLARAEVALKHLNLHSGISHLHGFCSFSSPFSMSLLGSHKMSSLPALEFFFLNSKNCPHDSVLVCSLPLSFLILFINDTKKPKRGPQFPKYHIMVVLRPSPPKILKQTLPAL